MYTCESVALAKVLRVRILLTARHEWWLALSPHNLLKNVAITSAKKTNCMANQVLGRTQHNTTK
eukprot:4776328-Amphidinium_carterae.1